MSVRIATRRTVALAVVAAILPAAAAQAAIVTVGSPLTQAFKPTEIHAVATIANSALPEPGANVASPISGTVIHWRISGAEGGPFKLRILRPAGPETFTGAGTSAPASPTSTGLQVFDTALPIQAGDLIGVDNSSAAGDKIGTFTPLGGAAFLAWGPPLPDGSTVEAKEAAPGREIAIGAEVQPLPTLVSLAPKAGSIKGGTKVTITGTDFTGATTVAFGATPSTSFSIDSETQITAKAPKVKSPGRVDVLVTTAAGTTTAGSADRFTYEACRVPNLTGKSLKKAKKRLRKAGCRLGKLKLARGATRHSGRVVKQKPKPGKVLALKAKVRLTLG